jgi:GGDEF domain-containing protein
MASTTSNRPRRFALPDLKDERADGVIEAYLHGPKVRKARPKTASAVKPGSELAVQEHTADVVADSSDAVVQAPDAAELPTAVAGELPTPDAAVVPAEEAHAPADVSPAGAATTLRPRTGDAVALRTMPGRLAWNDALNRESTRSTRYGRPSAVAIFDLRPVRPSATMDSWVRVHAAPIGQALLRLSRATDIVARVATTRYQVLLPETTSDGADEFVERIVGECEHQLQSMGAPIKVQASVAASSAEVPLHDALATALRSIEAA